MPQENAEFLMDDGCLYFVDDASDYDYSDADTASIAGTSSTMSTLESVEARSYFREVDGRMFPADSNVPLLLPIDNDEVRRLEKQHLILKLILEEDYLGPMREVLVLNPMLERRKRVLDLVTLDGSWVQEMSQVFPDVDFVSIDSTPLRPHTPRPNVVFEVYDLYNGLAEPDNSFDIVHIRYAVIFVKDFKSLVRDVHRVLRPGGLLLFCEYEFEVYDALFPDVPAWGTLPGMSNALRLVRGGLAAQGVNAYIWRDLPQWLPCNSSFWKESELESDAYFVGGGDTEHAKRIVRRPLRPRFDQMLRRGFTDVQARVNLVPVAPWSEDPRLRSIGAMVQEVWLDMWQGMASSFRAQGLSAQEAQETVQAAMYDIRYPSVRMCAKLHTLLAYRVEDK
ncbi:methyltransferase domain protein [Ceratobasidium sp. AG-Ba]|nr:methyltransferase domain protein [Ceratobasidium sp. AG-Ba]